MMRKVILGISIAFLVGACTNDHLTDPLDAELDTVISSISPDNNKDYYILPESKDLASIKQDESSNPLTRQKVELGKMLFYETGIALDAANEAGMGTYSCATCHIPEKGFMPGRVQGIADGGIGYGYDGEGRTASSFYDEGEMDVQAVRPLSVLNSCFVTNTFWNGQFGAGGVNIGTEDVWVNSELTMINHEGLSGLESQNIEGLTAHRMVISPEVIEGLGYRGMFDAAFSDFPLEERYTDKTASFALSAYLRTLLPTEAPFQDWLKGDNNAMTEEEKRGAILFFGKANCASCHNSPGLNNMEFYAIGVKDLYETGEANGENLENDKRNLGRGGFTGNEEDMFKFKVPQLYNLKKSPFYFHGSSKRSLKEVVEYFNEAIPEKTGNAILDNNLAPHFRPLGLSENEVDDIVSFLTHSLYDPDLGRYMPEEVLSGNCFPNNDSLSRLEIGCD